MNVYGWGLMHPQHWVIVEIALFDDAVFDCDFRFQCGGQPINRRAFDLGLYERWVDDDAAIDN
jgi:hypothetical protein